jgi:hypothetical protein
MKFDGFIGPSYSLAEPSASAQRLVNLYPETNEAGPRKGNVARFVGTPGLRKVATLGVGPIRGMHRASTGQLFVVSGSSLYEVASDWTGSHRSGILASSEGRVTLADDGTRIMIGDGGVKAYQSNLLSGSLIPVAAADCPGGHVAWQDGYFVNTVPGTGVFGISDLNDITYNATERATAEGRPDNLQMVLSVNRLLWLFGDQTTEVWWNSGAPDFPFERNESAFLETGIVAPGTAVRVANSVAWVSNDERGVGTVWYANGFQLQRISTHAVELALASYPRLSEASAFAYQQGGHEFYQLSVPMPDDRSGPGGTWVFDFGTQLWHERSYLGSNGEEPHRAWVGGVAFGHVVAGDREDGRLYVYDTQYFMDDAGPIRRLRQAPHISQDEKRIRYNSFELQTEPGVGLAVGQGSSPIVLLSWSDDGGHTWSNEHPVSMGAMGKYRTRAKWWRLGVARDRVFRVATSEPVPVTWLGVELDLAELDR